MLNSQHDQRGLTLIELMIGLTIAVILIAAAAPNFTAWIQGAQIRTATEAIQNGLQLARAQAVSRNNTVQFTLCGATDSSWDVLAASATALAQPCNTVNAGAATGWERIQMRSAQEGSANAVVAAGQAAIVFNGLGRVTPVPAANISFDVTNPKGGRSLRVVISPGGLIRMCDPALTLTRPTDAQAC